MLLGINMKTVERFLNSKLYISMIVILAGITFVARGPYQDLNTYLTMFFLVTFSLLLILFKNTLYTLPIAFALIYTYNTKILV